MAGIRESIEYDLSQAEAGLRQLGQTLRKTADSTDEVRDAAHRAEGAVKQMEEGAGAAGSALGRLGGAADLLIPGLGGVVRSGADLADVLEVAGQAGGALGVGMGTLLTVLGPIVALVGTLGYAWSEASKREEEAAERARNHADALSDVAAAMRKVAAAQAEVDTRAGLLTGEVSQQEADLDRARRAAASVTQPEREKVQEQLAAELARQNVIRAQESGTGTGVLGGVKDLLFGASSSELATEASSVAANIKELEGRLKELDAQENVLAVSTATVVEGERQAAERTKERATATKEATAAEDAAQKALEARAAAVVKATLAYAEAQDPLLAYRNRLAEIDDLEARGVLTAEQAAAARYAAAAQATAGSRDGGAGNAADLAAQQARDDAAAKAAADAGAMAAASRLSTTQTVANLGGQLLGGDVVGAAAGALSTLGPYGAVAGGALQVVATLGEQGADSIAASIRSGLETLVTGLEELPDLIHQLPDILTEMIPDLAAALVEAGPELALALAQAQIEALAGLPETIGEALYDAFERVVDRLAEVIRSPGDALFGEDRSLGQRLRGGLVTTARAALGVGTLGASEIALGAANAATDGKVSDRLYGDTRGSDRYGRASRRIADHTARADHRASLQGLVPRDADVVGAAVADSVRRADLKLPTRGDPTRNSS